LAAEVSQNLETIAAEIDRFMQLVGKKVAFSLFVWTDSRSNHISTADRKEVAAVMVEHLKGWPRACRILPRMKSSDAVSANAVARPRLTFACLYLSPPQPLRDVSNGFQIAPKHKRRGKGAARSLTRF